MRTTDHAFDLDLSGTKPVASRIERLARLVKTVLRLSRNRQQIQRLNELDDHQLLDMGLLREDLREAATSPFFFDQAAHLTRAARLRTQQYYRNARSG